MADDSFEGVRIAFGEGGGDGWFLIRLSVHDPVMPMNVESNVEGGAKVIAAKLYNFLKDGGYAVNIDPLKEFLA